MDKAALTGRTIILPPEVTAFKRRLGMLWDWFILTWVLMGYVTLLLVGGMFITRLIIFLWDGVLGEYFGR